MFNFDYGVRHNLRSDIPEVGESKDYSGLGKAEAEEMRRADNIDLNVRRRQKQERRNFKGYDN